MEFETVTSAILIAILVIILLQIYNHCTKKSEDEPRPDDNINSTGCSCENEIHTINEKIKELEFQGERLKNSDENLKQGLAYQAQAQNILNERV